MKVARTVRIGGKVGDSFKHLPIDNKAASEKKDLLVVEGASHYDLYDQPEPVKIAVEKLTSFYNDNL